MRLKKNQNKDSFCTIQWIVSTLDAENKIYTKQDLLPYKLKYNKLK